MSLRFNRLEPLFRTLRELPGIGRRPRTKDDVRLERNLPINFMVVRQKPTQTFIFRVLLAMNLDFIYRHSIIEEKFSSQITGANLIIAQ